MARIISRFGGGMFGAVLVVLVLFLLALVAAIALGVYIWLVVQVLSFLNVDIAFLWDGR